MKINPICYSISKAIKRFIVGCLSRGRTICLLCSSLVASEISNNNFHPDQLVVAPEVVYVVSSFEEIDYFTVFSHEGVGIWEIPFSSKIRSWKICDNSLFVFSEGRNKKVCFLSCFDAISGELKWEKPIVAPTSTNAETKPSFSESKVNTDSS